MIVYKGILSEKDIVPEDEAFEYALEKVKENYRGIKQGFVEWYFSGDFVKEEISEIEYINKYL